LWRIRELLVKKKKKSTLKGVSVIIAFVALDKDGRVIGYGVHKVENKARVKKEIQEKFKNGSQIKTVEILLTKE
jgi:hypothetical protein